MNTDKIFRRVIVLLLTSLLVAGVVPVSAGGIPVDISSATVTWGDTYTYTGQALVPMDVSVEHGGIELTEGIDYTVVSDGEKLGDGTFSEIKNVGTYNNATITITGIGAFANTIKSTQPIRVLHAIISIDSATVKNKTYDGNNTAEVINVAIDGLVNGEELKLGTDYSVSATFEDAEVGENKLVEVVLNLKNTGVANNYIVRTRPLYWTTGTITKVPPTPTVKPTATPTVKPTVKPTTKPKVKPTTKPKAKPTTKPTVTSKPTATPTSKPTAIPTSKPSSVNKIGNNSGTTQANTAKTMSSKGAATSDMVNVIPLGLMMVFSFGVIASIAARKKQVKQSEK